MESRFEVAQDVQTSERVPGIGTAPESPAGGPGDLCYRLAVRGRGAAGIQIVRVHLHGSQQRERTGAGQPALETASGMEIESRPKRRSPFRATARIRRCIFRSRPDVVKQSAYTITAVAEYNGHSYDGGLSPDRLSRRCGRILFIAPQPIRPSASTSRPRRACTFGFLPGTGDDVPKALENLEQNVRILATSRSHSRRSQRLRHHHPRHPRLRRPRRI